MGQAKLLLKLGDQTIIRRLVDVLETAGVDRTYVLVRADDSDLQRELAALNCETVIAEHDPPEMRDSVEFLIQYVSQTRSLQPADHWLLIPADHPFVEADTVKQLVEASGKYPQQILLPTHQLERGHPTLFPWALASDVSQIPPDKGLNWLVRRDPERVIELPIHRASILFDLDTPEDFAQAKQLDSEGNCKSRRE